MKMDIEITSLKVNTWINLETLEKFFGVDVKIGMHWYHLKDDSGPLWFPSKYKAQQKIKELKKGDFHGIATLDKHKKRHLTITTNAK